MNRTNLSIAAWTALGLLGICLATSTFAQELRDVEKDRLTGEIQRLQKAFEHFDQERRQLRAELEKERSQNEDLRKRLEGFRDALERSRKAIAVYRDRLTTLTSEPGDLQKHLDQANVRLVELQSANEQLDRQVRQLEAGVLREQRLRQAQEQMTQQKELESHEAGLRAESLARQVKLFSAERDRLNQEIGALRNQAEKEYERVTSLQESLKKHEQRAGEEGRQIQGKLEEIERLNAELNRTRSELATVQEEARKREAELTKRLGRAGDSVKRLSELEARQRETSDELIRAQNSLREEQQVRRDLERAVHEAEQSVLDLTMRLEQERLAASQVSDEHSQLIEDLRVFEKALEQERSRRQVQEDLMRRLRTTAGTSQREVDDLKNQIESVERSRLAAEQRNEELRSAFEALQQEHASLAGQAEAASLRLQDEERSTRALQVKLDELQSGHDQAMQNIEILKKAVLRERALRMERAGPDQAELARLQEAYDRQISDLEQDIANLQAANNEATLAANMLKEALNAERKERPVLEAEVSRERQLRLMAENELVKQASLIEQARQRGYAEARKEWEAQSASRERQDEAVQKASQQVQALQRQLAQERTARERSESELDQMRQDLVIAEETARSAEAQLLEQADLSASEQRIRQQAQALQRHLAQERAGRERVEKALEQARIDLQAAEDAARAAEARLASADDLANAEQRTRQQAQALQRQLAQERVARERAEKAVEQARDDVARYQEIASLNEARLKELESSQVTEQHLQVLQQQVAHEQAARARAESAAKRASQDVNRLEEAVQQAERQLVSKDDLAVAERQLRQELQTVQRDLARERTARERAESAAEQARGIISRMEDTSRQLADNLARQEDWAASEQTLRRELQSVQRDLAQERSARERLEMEAVRTREEMARMADKSTTLQSEVDQQQVELRQARQAARRQSATVGAAGDRPVPSRFGQTESEIRAEEERQRALTKAEQPQPTPTPLVDSFSELEAVLADLDAGQATQAQAAEPTPEPPQTQPVGRLVERAFALYGRGDVQRAKNVLDEVLALDPDHVDALGVRGVIAWQEGDVGGALVILEKALSLSDANPRVHNYMGIVQNSLQQHAQAEQSFRRAISLDPDYDEPLFNLAVILATTGVPRIDEARRFYERSLVLGSERNVNLERVIYP